MSGTFMYTFPISHKYSAKNKHNKYAVYVCM